MAHQLTEGALWKISQGDIVTEPVLQVLGQGWVVYITFIYQIDKTF